MPVEEKRSCAALLAPGTVCGGQSTSKPLAPNPKESLVELMDNLNTFIGTSTKLVHSIKETVELNNKQQAEQEARAAQEAKARAAKAAAEARARAVADACSCPNLEEAGKKLFTLPPTPPVTPTSTVLLESAPGTTNPAITLTPPDATEISAIAEGSALNMSRAPVAASTMVAKQESLLQTVTVPCPYSTPCTLSCSKEDIPEKLEKKGCGPKPEKCSKMVKMRKLMMDKIRKERAERTKQIKESMAIAQKNLTVIQEQIRQLDRLYEDYEMINTPDGEINPAALYKEIMKPTTVPYPDVTKPDTAQPIPCPKPANTCNPCPAKIAAMSLPGSSAAQSTACPGSPGRKKANKGNKTVLTAVAIDSYYKD